MSATQRSTINLCRLGATTLALIAIGHLAQCSSDDGGNGDPPAPAVTAVMGQVTDVTGGPLAGVTVSGGGATATTDDKGSFELAAKAGAAVVVGLAKQGYVPTQRVVDVQDGSATALTASMMPEAAAVPLDADAGGTVTAARGAQLSAPAGAFVDGAGKPVSGPVQVHLTAFDPGEAAHLATLPTLRAEGAGGGQVELESFGLLDVTVRQGTETLQVKSGEKLAIRIPMGSAGTAPETIPLWSYDEQAGLWKKEGQATLNAAKKVYEAEISHMSMWNCDLEMETTCVRGRVKVESGAALPGAHVTSQGVDYGGTSGATTDEEGHFCIAVRRSSKVRITATHPLGGGQSREVDSGGTVASLPLDCSSCLDVGEWVVKQGSYSSGGGEAVDCKAVNNPLAGTCAESMWSFGECFRPEGKCKMKLGGDITWDNGARMVIKGTQSFEYYGPSGDLCATGEIKSADQNSAQIAITPAGGQTYVMTTTQNGGSLVTCPDGTQVTISGDDLAALQACTGGNAGEEACEVEGVPGQCTDNDSCPPGQVCCDIQGGMRFCVPPEACPAS